MEGLEWICLTCLVCAALVMGLAIGHVTGHRDAMNGITADEQDKICQFHRDSECESCHDKLFDRENALRNADGQRRMLEATLETCHADYASCRKDLYETWKDLNVTCECGGD